LTFKLHQKIVQGFGYPLSMSNWILYCKKRHSLLMRCFIIFMQCIRNIGGAHGRLCSPLFMVHTMPSWHKYIDSQIAHKRPDLAYPLSMGNGFALPWEISITAEVFIITFLRCISRIWGASDSIHEPLVVQTVSFPPRLTLKLYTKCKILDTLSAWKNWLCATIRGIHSVKQFYNLPQMHNQETYE